ncbi:hypothetical protein [Chryseobacterium sp.]|uniref:FEKKY domain-containing protein n=1 Tax=Chryseobacterium sp. TaxID=1871047 RepID=UPI00388E0A12
MIKKLTILNIIILILIFISNIGEFYAINYPIKFDLFHNFSNYGFGYLLITFSIIVVITYLISNLNIQNLSFKHKFLAFFALINTIFLFFLVFTGFSKYNENKINYLKLENIYITQAKKDITADNVTYEYAGGLIISECDQTIENKIDSIYKKYGVTYFNTGCNIMEDQNKAQEKYAEIVKPYLEKRNGKNWEQKMKFEIELLKRDCR